MIAGALAVAVILALCTALGVALVLLVTAARAAMQAEERCRQWEAWAELEYGDDVPSPAALRWAERMLTPGE